jgi:outer membrane lipoprotein-sorting protein
MLNNRTSSLSAFTLKLLPAPLVSSVLLGLAFAQAPTGPAQAPPGAMPTAGSTGQAAAPARPDEPPTEAERFIDGAIKKIAGLQSISADLSQYVEMLNQKFSITGKFLKAAKNRVYLRLTVAGLPDTSSTTLQICDGETLWDFQRVLDSQFYRKLSIKPVLERLESPDLDPRIKEQAISQMGFAGPEALLVSLRKVIRFTLKEDGKLDGKNVWILRGTWKSRQGLVMPNSQPVPATGPLPYYVPSDATLYLGKDDSWPYKVVLVGRVPSDLLDTRRQGPDGRRIGALRSIERPTPSRLEMVYSEVKLNAPIKVDEFAFQAPPGANVEDNTEAIVTTLDKAIQMESARKKSEASRKEGPEIDAIDVPSTSIEKTPKGAVP